jgi:hypothetical protein
MAPPIARSVAVLGVFILVVTGAQAQADLELAAALQGSFDRCTSRITVRVVTRTERAALDYLAYDRNPLLHYPTPEGLRAPAQSPALHELDFGGALVADSIRDRLADTPLTSAEKDAPLAWQPVSKVLTEWDYDSAQGLLKAASGVSGEKWGNKSLVRPLQQIAAAYLHGDQLWVKVEFRPEVTWLPVDDEDGDAYPELYARVSPEAFGPGVLEYLRGDYLTKPLDAEETLDYFFQLSSDWYQALQTVPLEPEECRPWPSADTEADIRELMAGGSFAEPLVVIRGKPYGQVMYNVFLLALADRPTDWQGDLEKWGGSWEAWSGLLASFQADVRKQLADRPAELRGLIGKDDWLFYRGDLEYLLSGDLRQQPNKRDPYPAVVDFDQQLKARGIDMLFVVIPTKAEVYPEKLSAEAPPGARPYAAPYCRKLLGELAQAGVGVVDLLPRFIDARGGDEPLYMAQDVHWTNRGVRLAAQVIADAVRARPVHSALPLESVAYAARDATCTRLGDICPMLTDEERIAYRPAKLAARQVVNPDGSLYEDDPESPLVMLGDSFTGVFELEDCKHAGLSAQVALDLGLPVDLIMAQGSGPRIRGQLARRGHDAISAKKLVIWTVVSRDLYNYWAPWDVIRIP